MSDIKCAQCGHENDHTRVFCQNCGARLERPEGAAAPKISGPTKVPTGPVKIRPKGRGPLGVLVWIVRQLVSSAILGAILALVIQMGRAPENIPAAKPGNEQAARQLYDTVRSFQESLYPRALDVTQDQCNNYLAARVLPVAATDGGIALRAEFQRAFVVIRTGEASFFVEQKILGWPVFLYLKVVPGAAGQPSPVVGGGVGRVAFPEQLLPVLEKIINPVVVSVSDLAPLLSNANAVTFAPGVAKVGWPGGKPPGR